MSSAAVLIRLADEAPALVVGAYRLTIASLAVLPTASLLAHRELRGYTKELFPLALASGVLLALHFSFWITSLYYTSVASSVVLVTTNPLLVALLSHWFTRDKVSRMAVLGIVVALSGSSLIAFTDAELGLGALQGDVLALLGSAAVAGHVLVGRRLRRELSLLAYVAVAYPVAAAVLVGAAALAGGPLTGFAPATYSYLLLLGLLPQLLGHSSLNWALGHLSAVAVSSAVMAEPVGATLLAFLFLKEVPRVSQIVGGAVVLSGVYLVLRSEQPQESPQPWDGILKQ